MTEEIKKGLGKLDNAKSRIDVVRMERDRLIDGVYTPEIRTQVKEIEEEFDTTLEIIQDEITEIKDVLKGQVIQHGESVKIDLGTGTASAVFVKGRETWDTKRLNGYAVAHPEILVLKKVGDPTVRFK